MPLASQAILCLKPRGAERGEPKGMNSRSIGLVAGLALFAVTLVLPAPAGMGPQAWTVAGLVALMACWWMTEAIPLTATALVPFLVLPFAGVMTAAETASSYYSPILFLILG